MFIPGVLMAACSYRGAVLSLAPDTVLCSTGCLGLPTVPHTVLRAQPPSRGRGGSWPRGAMSKAAMEVMGEPSAEKVTYKAIPPQRRGKETTVEFDLRGLQVHEDYFIKLDVGPRTSLRVAVGFDDETGPRLSLSRARINLYASLTEQPAPIKYRYQTELEECDDVPRQVIYEWSAVEGMVTLAAFSNSPIGRLVVECTVGAPVKLSNDLCHIWKICSLATPSVEDIAAVKMWLWERHTGLLLDGDGNSPSLIYDDTGRTPFHRLCDGLGEVSLCKLLLAEYSRLVDPTLPDKRTGGTALHSLAKHPHLHDGRGIDGFRYRRAVALAEALVAAECTVAAQDDEGNTPLHYACYHFRGDVGLLRALLRSVKRDLTVRNKRGETALEMYEQSPHCTPQGREMLREEIEAAKEVDLVGGPAAAPVAAYGSLMRGPPPLGTSLKANERINPCPEAVVRCGTTGYPMGLNEQRLADEFRRYDRNGNGVLSREEVRRVYREYESFGSTPTDAEVDSMLNSLGIMGDGKVTLDEFGVLLLHLEARS